MTTQSERRGFHPRLLLAAAFAAAGIAGRAQAQLVPPRGPDFDDDGISDMVIGGPNFGGVPGQPGTAPGGGIVHTYVGDATTTGFDPHFALFFDIHENDGLGSSLAWGKFDNDAFDDLFVGIPWDFDDAGGPIGAVFVYRGNPGGAGNVAPVMITRKKAGMLGTGISNERFGHSLAVGDFDGDGFDDLAIGAPGPEGEFPNGSVHIVYGKANGFDQFSRNQILTPSSGALGDGFGHALAAGDFNCDGAEDLAIGAPFTDIGLRQSPGKVYLSYGAKGESPVPGGLSTSLIAIRQGAPFGGVTITSGALAGEEFGYSLAAGNFPGRSVARNGVTRPCIGLAIGSPGENVDGASPRSGAVHVLNGSINGLTGTAHIYLHQNSTMGGLAVQDVAETDDEFGKALAITRANADNADELIVGVPGENSGAGAIHVFNSIVNLGVPGGNDKFWNQATASVPGTPEAGDAFGAAVGGDESGALVIGVPFENITHDGTAYVDAGAAAVITTSSAADGTISIGGTRDCNQLDFFGLVADHQFGATVTAARPGFRR